MSPNTFGPNDVLRDDNYFLWEFNARMTLARKDLLDHVTAKPEQAMQRETVEWKATDMKALAVLSKLLSPTYQSMIRDALTAMEAWEALRSFFVKQNLHNRVQLRKQLHEFQMSNGENLMDHFLRFDDLCLRLQAVGDTLDNDERLVILLESLPREYDGMVKIIESRGDVKLLEAKEMLRREYESLQKREKREAAFKAVVHGNRGRRMLDRRQSIGGGRGGASGGHGGGARRGERQRGGAGRQQDFRGRQGSKGFTGRCFECQQVGHKQDECPRRQRDDDGEFVFSATSETTTAWLLDSGASSHMTNDRDDFCDFEDLCGSLEISVANGQRLAACGVGSVQFFVEQWTTHQVD